MVFAFHTIEAYLNYVGERLAPEIWRDERNYFRKEPYRGWEGKLRKVLELVSMTWSPTTSPLSTVLELRQLRDLIGHGKAEKLAAEIVHPLGTEAPFLSSTVTQMVAPKEKLRLMLSDVEAFLCQIHSSASTKLKAPDIWFGKHPLRGPSNYVVHSTSLHG